MADINVVGEHFSSRLSLCGSVSCLKKGDAESVQCCLSGVSSVLGDVSDTLAILSDFSGATSVKPGIVGVSENSMEGAVRLMSDVVGLCACLTYECCNAFPADRHKEEASKKERDTNAEIERILKNDPRILGTES